MFKSNNNVRLDLCIGVEGILRNYLHGIDIRGFNLDSIEAYIEAAQKELEDILSIKISLTKITENLEFYGDDQDRWITITSTYPIYKIVSLAGEIYDSKTDIPTQWARTRKDTEEVYPRTITILGSKGYTLGYNIESILLSYSLFSLIRNKTGNIPNYWELEYWSGFNKIPADLVDIISKMTCIKILNVLGDIVLGAGIASQSVSFDGFSQSIGTTSSAENAAYSARQKTYQKEVDELLKKIKSKYRGIQFTTL